MFEKFRPSSQCIRIIIAFVIMGFFWGYLYQSYLIAIPVSLLFGVFFARRFRCGKNKKNRDSHR